MYDCSPCENPLTRSQSRNKSAPKVTIESATSTSSAVVVIMLAFRSRPKHLELRRTSSCSSLLNFSQWVLNRLKKPSRKIKKKIRKIQKKIQKKIQFCFNKKN
jgi:hypothetical protein